MRTQYSYSPSRQPLEATATTTTTTTTTTSSRVYYGSY